ncbi:hypothetical protein STRCI_000025 [Streptomyces cinnabarinus]|uniref:Uncharacterized protein n=1 Tax=Streptomyces cinnabarinus TaxID=67287 RepID=A0ABY7K669_9ACTN|nr:hypothetical protein [Streptomyces cinnabarinus]WAZ19008.1 hypothetical protein STRCI_000025 [Streptomyces cinnabarinus]
MQRFETIPRDDDVEDAVAFRVHDPLWLLSRQWQLGEFRGQDAASPVFADVRAESHVLDSWRADDDTWRPYDPRTQPLEELVEAEPAPAADHELRVDGGVRWLTQLASAGLPETAEAFVTHCGFSDERAQPATGLLALVHGRIADGLRLAPLLDRLNTPAESAAVAEELGLSEAARVPLSQAADQWLRWWRPRVTASGAMAGDTAWDEHHLEYRCAARSSTLPSHEVHATAWTGGRLDWWAFDRVAVNAAPPPGGRPMAVTARNVPAPARFPGMPTPRLWEMEDARIDFGAIDTTALDLGRLLMITFGTVYGNDWYTLPLRLPVASLTRLTDFTVTDVFSRRHAVERAATNDSGWELFGLTDTAAPDTTDPWFFLAPVLPQALESPPVEAVLLLRDEMANLAWAVEQNVQDDETGEVIDCYDRWTAARPEPDLLPPDAAPRYRVDSEVPSYWFPLAPVRIGAGAAVRLQLTPLARYSASPEAAPAPQLPEGRFLGHVEADRPVWVYEEEVPRSGASLTRTRQRARWHDGTIHTWTGRHKTNGTGEGASGLRFDFLESTLP